jgi:hypothetical protein
MSTSSASSKDNAVRTSEDVSADGAPEVLPEAPPPALAPSEQHDVAATSSVAAEAEQGDGPAAASASSSAVGQGQGHTSAVSVVIGPYGAAAACDAGVVVVSAHGAAAASEVGVASVGQGGAAATSNAANSSSVMIDPNGRAPVRRSSKRT